MLFLYFLLSLLVLLLGYFFLLAVFPKGFLFQELLSIPVFWWRVWRSRTNQMKVTKHFYGKHRRQYLLCCEPLQGEGNSEEVVIYYHGGAWMLGTPEQFQSNAQFFVDRGYTVFMPSFRRVPFYAYPDIEKDLDQTLALVQQLKKEKGLEKAKILLSGMSAGGNVVGLLAYDRQRLQRLGYSQHIFSGVLLFGAPLDLTGMQRSLVLRRYAGKWDSHQFQQASPSHHLQEEEQLPLCCVHGAKDGMVPLEAARRFIERLESRQRGILRFEVLENGNHLDSGSWVHTDNEVRQIMEEWMALRVKQ